jgi:futalosine hydrolase
MTTWIVAALDSELSLLKTESRALPYRQVQGLLSYCGRIGKARVYLAAVGTGVVSAALGLATFAVSIGADKAIMIGSAGAYPGSGLEVGDLAVASSEILSELGVCVSPGIGDGGSLGLPGLAQEIPLDRALAERLVESISNDARVKLGGFLTVLGVSSEPAHAETRALRFRALVENMEGYALALAGQRFGIQVCEVRAVSNIAGMRDKSTWNLPLANERAQSAVLSFLSRTL